MSHPAESEVRTDKPDGRSAGTVREVLGASLRLGLTSFGGPVAHIGYFRTEYVERRAWLDQASFADLVALCQALPGPASSQLGIAIGTRRAGLAGGLAAWTGFTLPSAIAMCILGLLAVSADIARTGVVHGLKLAAVAVVAHAVLVMAAQLTPDWPRRLIAIGSALLALLWATPFEQVAIIVAGAAFGLLLPRSGARSAAAPTPTRSVSRRVGMVALAVFVALLLGLPLLVAATGAPWLAVFESMYRAGALVFGGGHVVLPLLESSVVDPGWVSQDQFLAGYGAAQAVPGPLFTFAAYLGAVSLVGPGGAGGAAIATAGIFLPSLLLVWGATPFWDRLRSSMRFGRALNGINAAVVGLLAAALYDPVWISAVTDAFDVAIAAAAFGLLLTGRVKPVFVVAMCALAAQLIVSLG